MKRFFLIFTLLAAMAVSCTDYSARFEDLQNQVKALQNECTTLSDNAEGLNAMVSAIKKDDSLTDFSPIEEEGEVIGFRAVFKAAGEITVYNQQTGISVGSVDGKYYWMLCSEWLTDASGNKIEIGADSPLPRFGVQDDALVVSVDGGSSWQVLGSVDKNLITSVEEDEAQVVFTLSGGATIMIPKYQPFSIMLEGDEATLEEGGSVTFTYKITGAANPSVEVACGSKWSAVVTPGAASDEVGEDAVTSQGTITVSAAEGASSSEVLVLAGDDSGRTVTVKARITFKAAPEPEPGPYAVCHLMPCCRTFNTGTKFYTSSGWILNHDYTNIGHVRSILSKVQEAGINIVSIDFTNLSQWDENDLWSESMIQIRNIALVCAEKGMKFFFFIGNIAYYGLKPWNEIAEYIWNNWVDFESYHHYGFGDDRPMLVVFTPGTTYAGLIAAAPDSETDYLKRFHVGTCQVNDPITPTKTDGWGYRNYSQSSDGKVRFVCPNGGVPKSDWYRVDADEWERRMEWVLDAKEYMVIGSYDDTCDAIFWGIADVSGSWTSYHINGDTKDDPSCYYDIVRYVLKNRSK